MSDSLRPHGLQHAKPLVLHYLQEFAQTHVHWVDNAIQPSHPLLVPSPAFNLSQHQGLFSESAFRIRWPVLELQLQHQSFQWIFKVDFLEDWPVWSPCSSRDSQESSPAPEFESMDSFLLYVFNAVNVLVSNEFTVTQILINGFNFYLVQNIFKILFKFLLSLLCYLEMCFLLSMNLGIFQLYSGCWFLV